MVTLTLSIEDTVHGKFPIQNMSNAILTFIGTVFE